MNLSLDEKMSLLTGMEFWHTKSLDGKIKYLALSDGPHGVRKQLPGSDNDHAEPAICYPTASALASTFDPGIVGRIGDELGKESKEKGVNILLGPGVNMKRSPLCGRNFEYFSEDPYLAGKIATSFVNGVQQNGVGVSVKHYAANNQETHRMRSNSVISERALREIYLKTFETVVKNARPATLMASYNLINGTYSTENKWLLTDVLRNEWGYEGFVMSDWGACSNLTKAVKAGMSLEMPDTWGIHKEFLKEDLEKGLITEADIDRVIEPMLNIIEQYGQTKEEEDAIPRYKMDEFLALESTKRRHRLAYEAAVSAGVLLKNENVLPLKNTDRILVIGDLAITTRFQGGGSSHINAGEYPNVLDYMKEEFPNVAFARGYDSFRYDYDETMEKEALDKVYDADILLFCGGLTDLAEGEGYDRTTLSMPENQIHLLQKLIGLGRKIVFLSFGGAPFVIDSLEKIDAVLQMYLGGEAVAEAAVALLCGKENPSGHLAETWPLHIEDTPGFGTFGSREFNVQYKEGIFIGYRHYVTKMIPVQFPFGYGLSYTDFEFSNLSVEPTKDGFTVCFEMKNIGNRAGKCVPQLYVRNAKGNFDRAELELRGFDKILLSPGETKEICMKLGMDAFSVYDAENHAWVVPDGEYGICIGKSVEEIVLSETVFVNGVKDLTLNDYLPANSEAVGEKFNVTSSFAELAEYSQMARDIMDEHMATYRERFPNKSLDDPMIKMMIETFKDGTCDSAAIFSCGKIPYDQLLAVIDEANRNYNNK
jgi:beta-glucosidase